MKIPKTIKEGHDIEECLVSRWLLGQYQKAKRFLLAGNTRGTDWKIRQPKEAKIWSFRINGQFRAYGTFDKEGNLRIFEINNHQ